MTPRTAEPPKPDWALTGRERKAALAEAQGRKRPRRRWPWVVLLLAALGAGAYVARDRGLLPGAEVTQPEPAATVQPAEQPARAVVMQLLPGEITEVTQTSLRETVRVTGQLDPVRHLGIPAEVAGRIDTVEIKAGDAAQQGDVLVRIDIETLRNQVEQTRATADATRAQLDFARAQLERTRSLVERGVATATNLDSDAANVEQLQASLVALEQQVANAERSLEKATITAPFAGIVAERSVDPGAYVSPGTALLKLVDISALELAAGVPVAYAPRIQTGQAVEISVDGFEGRSFAGTIERIALNMASTGPSPVASRVWCTPSMSSVTIAFCGPPVPAMTVSATNRIDSLACAISSSTSAAMSSSKTCFLRSARSLKRLKASWSALSPRSKPSSTSFSRKACRPECLPITSDVDFTPTSSGRMIS